MSYLLPTVPRHGSLCSSVLCAVFIVFQCALPERNVTTGRLGNHPPIGTNAVNVKAPSRFRSVGSFGELLGR